MKWLIFLISTTLPSYLLRFKLGPLPSNVLEVLILFTFLVWAFRRGPRGLLDYFKKFPKPWLFTILLWLSAATLAMFISPNLRASAGIWKAYFIEPILFFFIFIDVIKTRSDLKLVFTALGISATYVGLIALAQRFLGWPIPSPWQTELRITSIFEYPNAVGLFLAPLVPLFVGKSRIWNIEYRMRDKVFFSLAALFSVTAIVLAKSEGAIVGTAAGLFVLGFLWSKKTRIVTIAATALIAVIILSAPITRSYIVEKASLSDWSGYVRKKMWGETLEMLRDRPLLGAGLAGYKTAVAPYHKTKAIEIFLYPHNIILNFWSELGLLGLLVFLWIIVLFYKKARENISKLEIGMGKLEITLMSSMAALVAHGLVDVPYFKNDLAILFWILIGAIIVLRD